MQGYPVLLHKQVAVAVTDGNTQRPQQTVPFVYRGVITAVKPQGIVVRALRAASFAEQTGKGVLVTAADGSFDIGRFESTVQSHVLDEGTNQEIFELRLPPGFQPSDQRQSPRREVKITASLYLRAVRGVLLPLDVRRRKIAAVVRDISEGGVQILCRGELPDGATVLLGMVVNEERFDQPAEVVWSWAVDGTHMIYGLQFTYPDMLLVDAVRRLGQ